MIGLAAVAAATLLLALAIVTPGRGPADAVGLLRASWSRRRRARSEREGDASLVPVLESLLAATRAGLVPRDAIAVAADRARGELAERLRDALANESLGVGLGEAFASARAGARGRIGAFLADLELCARARLASDRVAALIEDELGTLRFERELASDLAARTAGQRFQVWLLAAIVPALALYLATMSPTLAEQLCSPLGRFVFVPAGLAFELAGIVLSRRIVERACR
jgi:Flp pilus assembly protein TadB